MTSTMQRVPLFAALGLTMVACAPADDTTFTVLHAPAVVSRKTATISANLCGTAPIGAEISYRTADQPWRTVGREQPRIAGNEWTVELLASELQAGENTVEVRCGSGASAAIESLAFDYQPQAPALPLTVDWSQPLEVQDGQWETLVVDGERRVRPVPGTAHYDRILLATGAFGGGRRVEVEMVYRESNPHEVWTGFGVLTLWGGHLEEGEHRPRRGWRYGIAWHMRPYGAWCEFSNKIGDGERADAFAGRTEPEPAAGSRWRLVTECWPESGSGEHRGWRQRMKLWPADEPEPAEWIECADRGAATLPDDEYAVALVAHECQVEFAQVHVAPLSDTGQ